MRFVLARGLVWCFWIGALAAGNASAAQAARPGKLKVYISVDMEGVAGTVTQDQLGPTGFEYGKAREWMTQEALAAVGAAKQAGATEILVSDSHGNMENLLIELFPPDVRIVRSRPRRFSMMAGIDASFDAVLFIGYHASAGNPRGVRAHTISSAYLSRVALNGVAVSEGALNAAIAGHFLVPVVMMSGDDAAIDEVRSMVGPMEAAQTKKSLGFHSAETLTPHASSLLIAQTVKAALARRSEFKPYVLKPPIVVEVGFKNYMPAEALSYLRGVQRVDSRAIRFPAKDMLEASDFLVFLTTYNLALEP